MNGRRGGSALGCIGLVYVVGFLFTAAWYAIILFDGCDARTLRGRCVDESMIDVLVYSLIWPLHWVLELIDVLAK